MTDRFWEDYRVGRTWQLGEVRLSEADIVAFARRYDPQPFHLDPAAALDGPFNGLVASGWQTCAAVMRLLVEGFLSPASSLGSPGVDEVRWLRPVRPGVGYPLQVTVLEARVSRGKPDRGLLRSQLTLTEADGPPVLGLQAMNLVRRRSGGIVGPGH